MEVKHSSEYETFEWSLLMACERLRKLESDMRTFTSLTRDQVVAELRSLSYLNEPLARRLKEDEQASYFDKQADFVLNHGLHNHFLYTKRFEAEYAVIVLSSSALIEAIINMTLQFQLAQVNKSTLFDVVDKWNLMEKWEHGLLIVEPTYQLPKGTRMVELLKELISVRNAAAHNKGYLEIDGKRHHAGKPMYRVESDKQMSWLKEIANLPYNLCHFLAEKFGFVVNDMASVFPINLRGSKPF